MLYLGVVPQLFAKKYPWKLEANNMHIEFLQSTYDITES